MPWMSSSDALRNSKIVNSTPYIAPEMIVLEIEPSEMLALSSVGYTSNRARDDYEVPLTNFVMDGLTLVNMTDPLLLL